jgi:hypothetical protein
MKHEILRSLSREQIVTEIVKAYIIPAIFNEHQLSNGKPIQR